MTPKPEDEGKGRIGGRLADFLDEQELREEVEQEVMRVLSIPLSDGITMDDIHPYSQPCVRSAGG